MRKANKWTVQLSLENNFCNAKYTVYQCFSTGVPWASSKGSARYFNSIANVFLSFFIILTLGGEASLVHNLPNREFPDCI